MNKKRQMIIRSVFVALLILSAQLSFGGVAITSTVDSVANLNQLYNYDVDAVATPTAASYQLLTYPAGMTISSSTGLISWTPTSMSDGHKVVVRAYNASGEDLQTFNLYISNGVACDTSIISYWPLDLKAGNSSPEAVNGYDALYSGSSPIPALSTDAQIGKSISFSPISKFDSLYFVTDADQYEFEAGDNFSVSFWFKNEDDALAIPNSETFVGRKNSNGSTWDIRWSYSTGKIEFYLKDNGSTDTSLVNPVLIDDDNWHHVVATFYSDPTPETVSIIHLFVDGVSSTLNYDFWLDKFSGNAPLTIGYSQMFSYPFSGKLDEVAIWNKELLQADVNTLRSAGLANNPICQQGNIAPLISSTAITSATEDVAYSYQLTYSEMDGDPVTVSAPVLPSWLTFNPSTKILSGTPTNSNVGNHNVTLRVSDGIIDIDQVFVISVANVNDLPNISSTAGTTVNEDAAYTYTIVATDIDPGSSMTFGSTTQPSWLNFNPSTHVLSGTPTNAQVGTNPYQDYPVTLRVTDNTSAYVEQSFTIRVNQVNDAPVINSQNTLATNEDVVDTVTFSDLNVSDVDNVYPDDFTLTVQDGAYYTHTGNIVTPAENWSGVLTVPVNLYDGAATVPYNLSITVNAVNDAPTFDLPIKTGAIVDSLYTYTIATSDVEGQSRTLLCTQKPAWLTTFTSILGNGLLSGTPTLADVGSSTVTLTVSDGTTTTEQTFSLEVVTSNWPPVVTSDPELTASIEELYSYVFTATDQDDDELLYSFVTKPSWLIFVGSTHTLSGIPSADGTFDVTLRVTDGIAVVDQSFVITVGPNSITGIKSDFTNVFPNPASGIINFEFENVLGIANLKIFSMSGEMVKEVNFNNQKSFTLNISDLKSNGYIYLITTGDSYQTGKFIVK